jgi:photosystem II stability/assembly factor-like uncharacterized protein
VGVATKRVLNVQVESGLTRAEICRMGRAELVKQVAASRGQGKEASAAGAREYLEGIYRDEHGLIDPHGRARAVSERRQMLARQAKSTALGATDWTSVAPTDIGGRTRTLWIDPTNGSRVLAGMATGGIWETTDAGASWRPVDDAAESLVISSIVSDPANPRVLYAGTGEFSQGFYGYGVLKSTDGGQRWAVLPGTIPGTVDAFSTTTNPVPCSPTSSTAGFAFNFVGRVAVHPTQSNIVLAATRRGVYRSADSGGSWRCTTPYDVNVFREHIITDVKFDPNNGNNVVAAGYDGVLWVSRDTGLTWTRVAPARKADGTPVTGSEWTDRGISGRTELAWSKSRAGRVYGSMDINGGDIYVSDDHGMTWTLRAPSPRHLLRSNSDSERDGQGSYDNALWVDPTDDLHIKAGGIRLFETRNGGQSWVEISSSAIHVDHHVIASDPGYNGTSNRIMWFGNDGGVYRTTDALAVSGGAEFTNLRPAMTGLVGTQFYRFSAQRLPTGSLTMLGGLQDNNSIYSADGGRNWEAVLGGDGAYNAINPQETAYAYVSTQYGGIRMLYSLGIYSFCTRIVELSRSCNASNTQKTNFITPFILDPTRPQRMYVGSHSLWVSEDARQLVPTFRAIREPVLVTAAGSASSTNYINALAVAPTDALQVWVGYNAGQLAVSRNATATAPTWTEMAGKGLPTRRVLSIYVDPADANKVFVTYGGFSTDNLWRSTDGGNTWRSLHGNLPRVPISAFSRHPRSPDYYFVGTEVGVFTSRDAGVTWTAVNEGPAAVITNQFLWTDDTTLYLGTYGRGVWRASVPAVETSISPQTGWWWNAAESGRGFFLERQGNTLFVAGYLYAGDGRATWFTATGPLANGVFSADMTTFGGGQTLTGAYKPPAAGASLGRITLTFASEATATLTWPGGSSTLTRYAFGSGASSAGFESGWWWNASEAGRGYSIEVQGNRLFMVGFMYDDAGNPLWYLSEGTLANGTTYQSVWQQVANGQTLTGAYRPPTVSNGNVGSVRLEATGRTTMNLTLPGGRVLPLTRFSFGG